MNEHKESEIRQFRYGIIADMLSPHISKREITKLIKEKALREYDIPFSKKTSITESTIRKWLSLYRSKGLAGLIPRTRIDSGKTRKLAEEEQSVLLDYLERKPDVPATVALKKLQDEGKIKSFLSQSSLSRFVIASGLTQNERQKQKINEKQLKFEFYSPLECVQADVLHGFPVPDDKGRRKKALLLAFIDDATRRILYAEFADSEKSYLFERGLKHILKTHGRISRIYVDNGSTFISSQTERILSILGIVLVHSRPKKPAGRGKIERFFRTVRDQFLRPLDKEKVWSFESLNMKFKTWLESEYHRNPHRGLMNKTPLEVWLSKAHQIIHIDPTVDIDDVFKYELYRKVYKDNTITLEGVLFEVPGILAGKRIKIRFDFNTPYILDVFCDGLYIGRARKVDTYANTKVYRHTDTKEFTSKKKDDANPSVSAILSASKLD